MTNQTGNNDLSIWYVVALEVLFNLTFRSQFEKDTLSILSLLFVHIASPIDSMLSGRPADPLDWAQG